MLTPERVTSLREWGAQPKPFSQRKVELPTTDASKQQGSGRAWRAGLAGHTGRGATLTTEHSPASRKSHRAASLTAQTQTFLAHQFLAWKV